MEASLGRSGPLSHAGSLLSNGGSTPRDVSSPGGLTSGLTRPISPISSVSQGLHEPPPPPRQISQSASSFASTQGSHEDERLEGESEGQFYVSNYRASMTRGSFQAGEMVDQARRCSKTRKTLALPGSHWTQNPVAMEMMKAMSFKYALPTLQPRLTKFHGTHIPVLMCFNLLSTEVGRLAILDTFWKRIVQHPMIWQGIYCRDYGTKRCVWRTLHGKAGSDKCLYHLNCTNPTDYHEVCRQITAIPGRSGEELLDSYRSWRADQQVLMDAVQKRATLAAVQDTKGLNDIDEDDGCNLPGNLDATSLPPRPWKVRAHCTFGLSVGHGPDIPFSKQMEKPVPVLKASAWLQHQTERRRVKRRSPKRALKASAR